MSDDSETKSGSTLKSPFNGTTYTVMDGYKITHAIDVSKYNNENSDDNIDWSKVKAAGVESVIIRCGNRGYGTSGTLMTDPYFEENMQDALAADLKVGIYIYSQAITTSEAVEEAQHCLSLCGDYLTRLDLPIVMDVEYANPGGGDLGGRLYDADLSKAQQTSICKAFCKTIEDAGYQAMIYANKSMLTDDMNASELTDSGYQIWLARYNTSAGYTASPYTMWQYAENGEVSGIKGKVDVNFLYSSEDAGESPQWKSVSWMDNGSRKLSWSAVPGAEGYEIQRSLDQTNWSDITYLDGAASISYTDAAELKEEICYYRIRICYTENNEQKKGSWSEQIQAKLLPGTPKLIKLTAPDYQSLKLTWDAVSGADGYRVYRKESGGSWKRIKDDYTNTAYTDSTAVTGTTYYYTVRAYRLIDGEKVLSDYDKSGISGKAVLSTPKLDKVTSVNYKSLKVTWSGVSGAEGYRVYRKTLDESWKYVADVDSDVRSYTDGYKIPSGQKFTYTVRAFRVVDGTRVYSSYDKTGVSGTAIPSTPSFTLESAQKGKVKISWKKIDGATGYVVYHKTASGEWSRIKDITSGSTVSYTASDPSGQTYYYTVRAYRKTDNGNVYSKYKTGVSIKVK